MADLPLVLPFILYFSLPFYALVRKPSPYRPLLILPIAAIALYLVQFATTDHPIFDYLLGNLICGNLVSSIDFILLTDVQNELRLSGQTGPISRTSLSERLKWAWKLFIGVRGIGWAHEPKHALSIREKNVTRGSFVAKQTISLVGYVFTLRALEVYQHTTGSNYVPKHFSGTAHSIFETLQLPLLASLTTFAHMSMSYTSLGALSVGLKISDPEDWPPLFGALSDAYTIRRFWGRTWHQFLRRMVSSHGKYLAHRIFHLAKGSVASSYVQLYTAFFISGVIHHTGDYMISCLWQGRSLHFFLMQAVAITAEDGAIRFGKTMGIQGSCWWKGLGFVWCWLWFSYLLPIWLTPIFEVVDALRT
ncbi:membrane bound O-acyl transferase family-domain-containing protein [Collybia nuda]|uniref:Membrane bound O-acyl transferase family-domain-containing protein n=1 Tax=Collybia nuda TaxID=64659 RepID=A0A9P6CM09_9AGAR|nr:membrane bound O-acyl transferase family-domain-containing protein [Collybia nuda]